jgi:pyoverdine/dityrosine biosynthesis protein Dit1
LVELNDRRTRQRLLESALGLLAKRGLAGNLLRDAASAAGCPPERASIFFKRDEDLVFALYARLAADFESVVTELPDAGVADRFRAAMARKLDLVGPHRSAFASLVAVALDPRHRLGVLSDQTEIIRDRVRSVFDVAAGGDRARGRALYAAHLAILLLWTQDNSPGAEATRRALDLAGDLLDASDSMAAKLFARGAASRLDAVLAPLVEPEPDPAATKTAEKILRLLFRHRRLQDDAGACAKDPCSACLAIHLPHVRRFVRAKEPIHAVLPAFPAKSPSPRKTLGSRPDLAEEVSLAFLQSVCDAVRDIYPPGMRLTICSDGRVFGDLVGVADDDVTCYGRELAALIRERGARSLDVFRMEDLFEGDDFPAMRARLAKHYAEAVEAIEERTRQHESHRRLFNGIQRFLFEDRLGLDGGKSRTKLRSEARDDAYRVIQRSNAWGRLVTECFPGALRLSIHPQPPHSEKIGILLAEADDVWLTPWHAVALRSGKKVRLVHREEAERLGARLVERDGRPSHFEMP